MMHVVCGSRLCALRILDLLGVMRLEHQPIKVFDAVEGLRGQDLSGRVVISLGGHDGYRADLEEEARVCGALSVVRVVPAPQFWAQMTGGTAQRGGLG